MGTHSFTAEQRSLTDPLIVDRPAFGCGHSFEVNLTQHGHGTGDVDESVNNQYCGRGIKADPADRWVAAPRTLTTGHLS